MTTDRARTYSTIHDIKRAVLQPGGSRYWFTPETMKWFRSRVLDGTYAGHFFISSEVKPDPGARRRYSIRACDERGHIETVGEVQQYASAQVARSAMRRLEWLTFDVGRSERATAPIHIQTEQVQEPHATHLGVLKAQCAEAWSAGRDFGRAMPKQVAGRHADIDAAAGAWFTLIHGDVNDHRTDYYYGLRDCFKMGAYGVLNMADWDVRE